MNGSLFPVLLFFHHLLLLLLHSFKAGSEAGLFHFLRVFPVRFQLCQKRFLIRHFAHDDGSYHTDKRRNEVVVVQSRRIVVQYKQEHNGHQVRHPFHGCHLRIVTHILLLHHDNLIDDGCCTEEQTEQTQVVTQQWDAGAPADQIIIRRKVTCPQETLLTELDSIRNKEEQCQEMTELKVEELILDLLQTNIRFFPTLFDFYRDWNVDLKEFMEDHFTENLSLSEFASYSGRSLATFKRDFLKITELSPAKWLMTRRLGLAENLLKENKLSIKQISYSVGFKTPAHFSTAFKKRHEMTPSEYRASNTGCN